MSAPGRAGQRANTRQAARLHSRDQQRQRLTRQRRTRLALWIGIGLVLAIALGLAIVRSIQNQPGQAKPIQGQTHIEKGTAHVAYNSKPPTSGPHWNIGGEAPVSWGIQKEPIPDEAQIHNLEHGGVIISYNCRDCPELVKQLEDFYERYWPDHLLPFFRSSSKIIVAPYYDMPSKIALTAWGRIDTMEAFDEARAVRFIETWRDKGPEAVP